LLTKVVRKAKERQRQWVAKQVESEQPASTSNANGKRPMVPTPAGPPRVERDGAKAVNQQASAPKPLPRDTRLIGKYVEYDLSKMVNRKGGFLLEDGKEVDEEVRRKERQRELQRMQQNLEPRTFHQSSIGLHVLNLS
jgi:DNA-repair protein complementing XP-A cells